MALQQYSFGSGKVYMKPLGIVGASPVQVGTLQDISVDIIWAEKELQGSLDSPAAIARAAMKVTGKIKAAKFSVQDLSQVVFGNIPTTGTTNIAPDEGLPNGTAIPASVTLLTSAATANGSTLSFSSTAGVAVGQSVSGINIPAGTVVASFVANISVTMSKPVTSTGVLNGASIVFGPSITVINAATFVEDLGVVNVGTGVQLSPVLSGPTTGQYAVANGVYTFAIADVGNLVVISYNFTQALAGKSITYYAQAMGVRPTFKLELSNVGFMNNPAYAGQPIGLTLWNAGISKFSMDFKNEDFTVPETDFSASQDYMGRVFTMGANT